MENPVIILGAQAVGTAALDAFLSNEVVVYCILDDEPKLHNTELLDVPVMGNTDDGELLKLLGKKCEVFVATEDAASRRSLTKMLRDEYEVVPVNSIHQRASVSMHAELGHGNYVGPNAIIAATAKLGDGVLIGPNAVVEGQASVGDYAPARQRCPGRRGGQRRSQRLHRRGRGAGGRRKSGRQGPRRSRLGSSGRCARRPNGIWQPSR